MSFHQLDGTSAEVFYAPEGWLEGGAGPTLECAGAPESEAGWYWWPCFPGCLPDGDPCGPFPTFEAALEDATA